MSLFEPMRRKVDFMFRIWVSPLDGDPTRIEVWCHELELADNNTRSVTDWVMEAMSEEDFHYVFKLDPDKKYQILGEGTLRMFYDGYHDEYDQELQLVEQDREEL